jgi:8-oxo-dGTP diphosphatase
MAFGKGDPGLISLMQPHHHSPVAVAVGILLRPDGRFLMNTRPAGKPCAGSWEFPGGKIEPGETVVDTLRRELREELAIEIGDADNDCRQLQVVEHTYPHADVRLHVCVVSRWHGEPLAIEGQALSWQSIWDDTTHVSPVLPATVPVIQSLRSIRETLCVRPAATNLSSIRDAADDHSARLHAGPHLSR